MPQQQRAIQRQAGLRVVIRTWATGSALTIVGTVAGQRIRKRAQTSDYRLACEEAAALEAEILRTEWHGERRGSRFFGEAAESYLKAIERSANQKARVARLLRALGDPPLRTIDQQTAILLKNKMLRPGASERTYVAEVITPLRAILIHAHKQGWCDSPHFDVPHAKQGRTLYLLPSEAERLIAAAAPHLQPLLLFLLSTGARLSEALDLEWRDVDLAGGRATFWKTKNGRRRVAELLPAIVAVLANLPHRDGKVFRRTDRGGRVRDYVDRERRCGGQIKTAWAGALRRAGLGDEYNPHDLRHTWASWHYALYRDPMRLKIEGGWSSLALVERYVHLLPAGHEPAIRNFWQCHKADTNFATQTLSA
jgi:integrase